MEGRNTVDTEAFLHAMKPTKMQNAVEGLTI